MDCCGRNPRGRRWLAGLLLATAASAVWAQNGPVHAYAVATIHPSPSGPISLVGFSNRPDGIHGENATVLSMIDMAFQGLSTDRQILGVPDWVKNEKFHVDAKMSEADMASMQALDNNEKDALRIELMHSLLVDRFHMKAHTETRLLPVYDLTVARSGLKMQEFVPGNEMRGTGGKPIMGSIMMFMQGRVRAQAMTLDAITGFLAKQDSVARPVIDKTGLKGSYNFDLRVTAALPAPLAVNMAPTESEASIFTAVQEDLGLKLQSSTGLVKVVVIDQIERPTEN